MLSVYFKGKKVNFEMIVGFFLAFSYFQFSQNVRIYVSTNVR